MRLPRPRLMVRRMMVVVLLAALALAFILPAALRFIWIYQHPASVRDFGASILCKPAVGRDLPRARTGIPIYAAGRTYPIEVTSEITPANWLPEGLGYRGEVVVKVTDPTTFTQVYSSRRRSRRVVTGPKSAGGDREVANFDVTTPRTPGSYAVRYELHLSDAFGRTWSSASATSYFTVH